MDDNTKTNKGLLLKGIKNLAKHYRWGVQSTFDSIHNGIIPSHRKGNRWYFYTNEVDEALKYKPKEKEATPNQSDNL